MSWRYSTRSASDFAYKIDTLSLSEGSLGASYMQVCYTGMNDFRASWLL